MINTMKNKLKYTLTHEKNCSRLGVHFNTHKTDQVEEQETLGRCNHVVHNLIIEMHNLRLESCSHFS